MKFVEDVKNVCVIKLYNPKLPVFLLLKLSYSTSKCVIFIIPLGQLFIMLDVQNSKCEN
jgi:hypothetical protein